MANKKKELFKKFDKNSLTEYNSYMHKIKEYYEMLHLFCYNIYKEYINSDTYLKALAFGVDDIGEIKVDVPELLKENGMSHIEIRGKILRVYYTLDVLNIPEHCLYDSLKSIVLNIKHDKNDNEKIQVGVFLLDIDEYVYEFYYKTYLLLKAPDIFINEDTKIKYDDNKMLVFEFFNSYIYDLYDCVCKRDDISAVVYVNWFADIYDIMVTRDSSKDILYYVKTNNNLGLLYEFLRGTFYDKKPISIIFDCNKSDLVKKCGLLKVIWYLKLAECNNVYVEFLDTI